MGHSYIVSRSSTCFLAQNFVDFFRIATASSQVEAIFVLTHHDHGVLTCQKIIFESRKVAPVLYLTRTSKEARWSRQIFIVVFKLGKKIVETLRLLLRTTRHSSGFSEALAIPQVDQGGPLWQIRLTVSTLAQLNLLIVFLSLSLGVDCTDECRGLAVLTFFLEFIITIQFSDELNVICRRLRTRDRLGKAKTHLHGANGRASNSFLVAYFLLEVFGIGLRALRRVTSRASLRYDIELSALCLDVEVRMKVGALV